MWKSDFVDRQIRDALIRLFGPEPEPALVRLIRGRAQALSPAEVRSSLGRLRTTFDFPVALVASSEPVLPPTQTKAPKIEPAPTHVSAPTKKSEGTPWRGVSLGQLIAAGLVRVPLEIEHRYRGTDLIARIEGADRIVFSGAIYDSLSTAGGMARKSVAGAPQGRDYPQTNGWTFWQFRSPDRTLRALDDLRREFHERKVVNLSDGRRAEA